MTVSLVTGGSGYFGSLLVERLRSQGHTVQVFDLVDTDDRPDDVIFFPGDIRRAEDLRPALLGVDVVYNNVAQVPLARDSNLLYSVNVNGTQILLDLCLELGISKVVHTSSSAVFGIPVENPVSPSAQPNPVEAYGRAKWEAEKLCAAAVRNGLDVTIIRPRTILGHGRLGIFGILFDWIADGSDPFVLGKGDNVYQFVHAHDLAQACILAAQSPGPDVFNVGTDRFATMRNALENLCSHAGTGVRVRSLPTAPTVTAMRAMAALRIAPFAPYHWTMFGRSMYFDIEYVQDRLQWTPQWSNDEMFQDSYDWYCAHRNNHNDIVPSQHRRSARQGVLRLAKTVSRLLPD